MAEFVFKMPDVGEGIVEAEISVWHVQIGDVVKEDAPLVEINTDKATVEIQSPVDGEILELRGKQGENVAIGSEIVVFKVEADADENEENEKPCDERRDWPPTVPPERAARDEMAVACPNGKVLASPSVRRRGYEADLDLSNVPGTGPAGRVTHADLDGFLEPKQTAAGGAGETTNSVRETKLSSLRQVIAARMTESAQTIPHFSYIEEVDVTDLEALRAHLNETAQGPGEKLNLLPFLVLALRKAIADHPQFNAHFDTRTKTLSEYAAVHIGIAAQTPDGLKVPVLKHAEGLDILQISSEIRRLAEAARDNSATPSELGGSTITITSLGRFGGIATTPVINLPEVAIIGVNKILERPVVRDGAVAVRKMMNLSSSFDHRVIDGFDAALFVHHIKAQLEHPATLFI